MRQFRVVESTVEQVVKWYDTSVPARDGRRNYYKRLAGRLVRVTTAESGLSDPVIITVYAEEECDA